DAHELPQIFVKEARNAAAPAFEEKPITAVVKRPAFLQDVDLAHMPPLRGLTATVIKDEATEVVSTADNDPVLAFWPVGLGRTAVFASDVKDRWGADWVRWRGYGPFFSAVIHALERQHPTPLTLDVTPDAIRANTRTIRLATEARDAQGRYRDLLKPVFRVTSGTSAAREVPGRQVAPGRYEAAVVADARQPLTVSVLDRRTDGTGPSRTIVPDPAAEYRFRPPDEDLLKAIATATGGAWRPSPSALAPKAGERGTERRPLWPALAMTALGLRFVDLPVRRVRLFE